MDIEAHRDLKLLEEVEKDSRVTQRGLAHQLGIALGLTNIYLKRLVRKGYIKCVNVQSNRISYLITPRHRPESPPHVRVHVLLAPYVRRGAAASARCVPGVR